MTTELLHALARSRHERLVREAANRRALRRNKPPKPFRRALARAVRAMGYAVLSLGDALAESR